MKNEIIVASVLILVIVSLVFVASIFEIPQTSEEGLKKFSSYDELKSFIKTNMEISSYSGGVYSTMGGAVKSTAVAESSTAPSASASDQRSSDYSATNIQVSGVDEADIVKNDGDYIYMVSGKKILILDAYPAENAKIISEIALNGTPQEIFVNKDRLVIFGWEEAYYSKVSMPEIGIMPRYYSPNTFIKVYDITDRSAPLLKRDMSIEGNYFDSRMIGDYVYAVVNDPVYYSDPSPIPLPAVKENGRTTSISASDVYYFDFPDSSYIFSNVLSINTQNDAEEASTKTFLLGYSENMYVSPSNIYIVYTRRLNEYDFYDRIIDEVVMPSVPINVQMRISEIRNSDKEKYEKMQEISTVIQEYVESLGPEAGADFMKGMEEKAQTLQNEIAKEMEKTVIHKISVSNGQIEYKSSGEAPGYVLNQFSMDEYNGNFRIATTTGNWRAESMNHVYVLDGNLDVIGKLEDLAKGERIYSVRFMGEKAYMVTFRQIDPLFVVDLSNPANPAVLGYLKIPGVSDYLHPYDETHVIGVGRDASDEGRVKGMKLSLFDVSDVSNPKEVSKYMIGDRGTYSEALNDHKAFLFSKEKNLLVIPVRLVEGENWNAFQGAYVFNVNLDSGFTLKGRVTHENETINKTEYYYDWNSEVRRSLYMDNVLYTVSNKMVKMNSLDDLQEINKLEIPYEAEIYPYPLMETAARPV